jgi:hypothetical protein
MKHSNLGTMNALHIRWSAVVSKLEHGRLCRNLLDALAHSNLATWCPSWGKSPWLTTTTTPHSSLPCHCQPLALLLHFHQVPLSCMELLSCQACHLLPSISSPAPLLLCLVASLVQPTITCIRKCFTHICQRKIVEMGVAEILVIFTIFYQKCTIMIPSVD